MLFHGMKVGLEAKQSDDTIHAVRVMSLLQAISYHSIAPQVCTYCIASFSNLVTIESSALFSFREALNSWISTLPTVV